MTITFTATSIRALAPGKIQHVGSINNPEEMVNETKAFKSLYEKGGVVSQQRGRAPPNNNTEGKKDPPPEILTVKGTSGPIPARQGLVGTIVAAYNLHHNLQLRPDDIWVTILTQFCAYVNGRAEALRYKFVAHEGKKKLEVVARGTIETADFGWFTRAMLHKIEENLVDPSVAEWFLPGFSTTTPTDEVCAAATAMCSFQQYFEYKFRLKCGIPKVTLLGTVDDWERLRSKVEQLSKYDDPTVSEKVLADKWLPLLRVICDNFVESAKNGSTNNLHFWDTIVSREGGGSGPRYISGWASVFTFFDKDGKVIAKDKTEVHMFRGRRKATERSSEPFKTEVHKFRGKATEKSSEPFAWPLVDDSDINPNVVSCPVTIDDNGTEHKSRLFVGQMSVNVEDDPDTEQDRKECGVAQTDEPATRFLLIPRNDWALVIEKL